MLSGTFSETFDGAFATAPDELRALQGEHAHIAFLFETAALLYADQIAAIEPCGRHITYRELEQRSGKLAHRLAQAGVGRGSFVALCAGRSIDTLIAIVAIVRAGAAYVPIDPAYPDAQLEFMLADSNPAIVLADAAMRARLAQAMEAGAPVWLMEDVCAEGDNEVPLRSPERSPGDPIYVMYTSGSTGKPKGVVVPHRGVSRLVLDQDYCRLCPEEVILHLAPLAFDASTFEIWAALLNGGRLAIVTQERPSIDCIAAALVDHGVTTAWLTAGLFHLMVDCRIEALGGLSQLLAGGDVLSPDHVCRFLDAVPHCQLINGYGPTENTTFTCCAKIGPDGCVGDSVPIGRPIAGTEVFIVDESLRPVSRGTEGQLVASGAGLALGYLGQAELTHQKFVEAPAPISRRIYLTGDLVRALPDGEIEFLGRIDRQVKIDGKRVEPAEIEAVLRYCDGVIDACVVVDSTPSGMKRILAFVALGESGQEGRDKIVQSTLTEVRRRLPGYMWPAKIAPLTSLPLTPNGKVDRAALLESLGREAAVAPTEEKRDTPASPGIDCIDWEEQITGIWQRVLGTDLVGLDDVFFDIGGKSLQWMQVHADLQRLAGARIAITEMFARPTVRLLADYLGNSGRSESVGEGHLTNEARDRAMQRSAAMRRFRRT